jgi:outer membrane protein assembly factor BamB
MAILIVPGLVASAAVTGWRNDGTGLYPGSKFVTSWSQTENVIWKTPLEDKSNASPVISKNKIFICKESDTLLCVKLDDGSIAWEQALAWSDHADTNLVSIRPACHGVNGYATPTPVCDGKNVFVVFGSGIAASFDYDGNKQWVRHVGKPSHKWGHSASPMLSGKYLVIHMGNTVYALQPGTGEMVWEANSKSRWGSPLPLVIDGTDVLLTPGGDLLRSADGKKIGQGIAKMPWTSPVVSDGIVYVVDQPGATALQLPNTLTETFEVTKLWTATPKQDRYYSSSIVHEGLVYNISRQGFLSCLDAKTGEIVYEQRLPVVGTIYSSPCLVGENLLVSSDSGQMVLVRPGRSYEEIAQNKLDPFRSCPTFYKDRMYVRTMKHLYCIGGE